MSDKITYEAAYKELTEIVDRIESGEISLDELSQSVKRATVLIETCQEKLKTTEDDVSKILKDLEAKG